MRTRDQNPLARRHFNRIVKRPMAVIERLMNIWGVTWVLHGKTIVPFGSAPMMVLSSHPASGRNNQFIELRCVTAEVDPLVGDVHYSRIKMRHDFAKNPHVGARKMMLDPREADDPSVRQGDHPNAGWVRQALEVDTARVRACEQNWKLPVVPQMPRFLLGVISPESVPFEVTDALKQHVCHHMGRTMEEFEQIDPSMQETLLRAEWGSVFIDKADPANPTGFYLIDHKYVTNVTCSVRMFEDFREMVGVDVWNPMWALRMPELDNPALELAEAASLDLRGLLEELAKKTETNEDVTELETSIRSLHPAMRERLGVMSPLFTDDDLDNALVNPDDCIKASQTPQDLELDAAVQLLREFLRQQHPIVEEGCTDNDLVNAIENPNARLFASKLLPIQIMYRDLRIADEDAFVFNPSTLGRERVYANFWPGQEWRPQAAHNGGVVRNQSKRYAGKRNRRNSHARKSVSPVAS